MTHSKAAFGAKTFLVAILVSILLACGRAAFAHEHHAPHGGSLVEVGEEFAHVELVVDASTQTLKAYVLDGEAEGSVRVTQKTLRLRLKGAGQLELKSHQNPLTGESPGDSSEFSAHWIAPKRLTRLTRLTGVVESLSVQGARFKNLPFTLILDPHAQP